MGKCNKLHKTFADSLTCPDCVKVVCEMQLGELTQEFLKLRAVLEPIRRIQNKLKDYYSTIEEGELPTEPEEELWQAIQESVRRMRGGE